MRVIQPHLGLGDAVILSGAMVYLTQRLNEFIVFPCREENEISVRSFFRDFPSIDVWVCTEQEMMSVPDAIKTGWYNEDIPPFPFESFDQWFYRQLDIPIDEKWNSCPLRHAANRCDQLTSAEERYSFVHDDIGRGFLIDITPRMPVARPYKDHNSILSYVSMIERAEEVHVIDSCFLHLVDMLNPVGKLYLHRSARPSTNSPFNLPRLRHHWHIA